jgi:benzylsuccinate CoA-transferase BbsF subunit
VYPAAGTDRWIALACGDDEQRAALTDLTGGLDHDSISGWTATQLADVAAEVLQQRGIAAYAVQNSAEAYADPQLAHRSHFRTVAHPLLGEMTIEGTRFKMSRTLPLIDECGPTLGQHTEQVLTDILGYDDERFTELLIAGVIE